MSIQKHNILIIDDDEDIVMMYEMILEKHNYNVIKALSGYQGIEMAEQMKPELILLDILLPDIDGFEVLKRLKSSVITQNIFVVLHSANRTSTGDKVTGFSLGADGYLDKGVDHTEFIARIDAFIQHKLTLNKLIENQRQLKIIIDENSDGILIINSKKEIEYANNKATKIYNVTLNDLLGSKSDIPLQLINSTETILKIDPKKEIPVELKVGKISWNNSEMFLVTIRDLSDKIEKEKKEKELELTIKKIVENSTNLFYSHDVNHKLSFVSPQVEDILGYSVDEALINWTDFTTDNPINEIGFEKNIKAIKTGKNQGVYELELWHKTGKTVWVEVREAPVVENGKTVAIVGALSDVTERKVYLEELIKSETKFKLFFESAPIAIALISLEGKLVITNRSFEKMLGYSSEELHEAEFIKFLHPDDVAKSKEEFDKILKKQINRINIEKRYISRTGGIVWGNVKITAISDKNNKFMHMLVMAEDITQKKLTEEKLEENIEKYKELFYAESDAIFLIENKTQQILEANHAATELYGYSMDELLKLKNTDLSAEADKTRNITEETPIIKDNIITIPLRYHKTKDGNIFPVEITGRFFELKGKMVHIAAVRNITERIKITQELEKYKEELEYLVEERTKQFELQNEKLQKSHRAMSFLIEDVNESRNQLTKAYSKLKAVNEELESFAYSVSHDLRAPLTRIDGFSNAVLDFADENIDPKIKHYLSRIRASSQRMALLIDDLLKLSRITRSNMEFEDVNISKLALEIINELLEDKSYSHVKYNIEPGIVRSCDKQLIKVLLVNLISNAFKFSAKSEHPFVEIGTETIHNEQAIFIRDNGVGFDMKYYNQLFAPFSRLHSFDDYEGTGIGLATVQRVINKHGGKVWAESKINKETTFYFHI